MGLWLLDSQDVGVEIESDFGKSIDHFLTDLAFGNDRILCVDFQGLLGS